MTLTAEPAGVVETTARDLYRIMLRGVSSMVDDIERTKYVLHLQAIVNETKGMMDHLVDRHLHDLNTGAGMSVRAIEEELKVPKSTVQTAIGRVARPDGRTAKSRGQQNHTPEQRQPENEYAEQIPA